MDRHFRLARWAVIAVTAAVAAPMVTGQGAADARIARIQARLLPGIVVKGGPVQALTIDDRMRFHHTPGVSVAVVNDGVVEWARGYGVLEAGKAEVVTPRTRFQAASISKPVAATAALGLVQGGRLALDEDVNSRLTSWKVPASEFTTTEKVTLRRILSHTAGLTVHGFPGYASTEAVPSLVQVLDGAKPANTAPIRVDTTPGGAMRYSGGGYTVLQQMIVDVTRRPFPDFMRDAVLRPVHMDDSTYEQPLPAALTPRAAVAHDAHGTSIAGRYHTYPEMAAAGLWTTPTDLAKFAVEIQHAVAGRSAVLSAATAKQMLTPQKESYGLGLVLTGAGPNARFSHGGANEGFRCQMVAYTAGGQGAVVMTNGDAGGRLASEILRAIASEYGWPGYPRPKEKTVASVNPSVYQAYAGRYKMQPGHVVTVKVAAGRLLLVDGEQTIELLPESATKFFELVEDSELEFIKAPDGAVTDLLINGETRARRLR